MLTYRSELTRKLLSEEVDANFRELDTRTNMVIPILGVGDGTVNDTAAVATAFAQAELIGGKVVGAAGAVYAVSEPLFFGGDYAKLHDVTLKAIGTDWASGSFVLTVGESTNSSVKYADMRVQDVHVLGEHLAKGGINFLGMGGGTAVNCTAVQCLETQIQIGKADGSNSSSCTDTMFVNLHGSEWLWGEGGGETDYTQRTSRGLWLTSSDSVIIGGSFSRCRESGYFGAFYNALIMGTTFFAGQTRTDPDSLTVYLSAEANRADFVGCRFDDGRFEVHNYNNSIKACRFIQFTVAEQLRLIAEVAGETGEDFIFIGNSLTGAAALQTAGVGSWSSDPFKGIVQGNVNTATGLPYAIGGVVNTINQYVFAHSDGNIYTRADNTGMLGAPTNRFNSIYAVAFRVASGNCYISGGDGSPEGVVTAGKGSMYMRRDGGANTSFYIKESGTGNTGWVAK